MNENVYRVIVKGVNWSGSGTVIDLLREYRNCIQIPGGFSRLAPAGYLKSGEFDDFRIPNGVNHLLQKTISYEQKVDFLNYVNEKIKRDLRVFIKKIIKSKQLSEKLTAIRDFPIIFKLNRELKKLYKDIEINMNQEDRIKLANSWVSSVIKFSRKSIEIKHAIFDQSINLDSSPDIWSKVFDPYKLIIVHRDPRDQYAEQVNKGYYLKNSMARLLKEYNGNSLDLFIKETLLRQKEVDNIINSIPSANLLILKFEDIVLDYDKSKLNIEFFLNLDTNDHILKRKYLNPEWSKKNIGLYKANSISFEKSDFRRLIEWYNMH